MNSLIVPLLSHVGSIGSLCLVLALGFTLLGLCLSVLGGFKRNPFLEAMGVRSAWGTFAFATFAVLALEWALLTDDFSVRFVAEHGFTESPTWVKVVSLWGALEGSILFWAWILALYTFMLAFTAKKDILRPWAMGAMYLSLAFFLGINLTIANPFTPVVNPPTEGGGLNELLQNHWMMRVHPVLLYLGFVGLSVPFAYTLASLITGRVGSSWIVQTRAWTLTAWAFLSAAIVAGGYWSYEVLGWGGYWAWDPVEISSWIPWLFATAFLHSVQVQERKRGFIAWNLWLIVFAYSSTLFGTFLNRSGIVQSVHAFGSGPIGTTFLGFFAILLLLSVGLASWRSKLIRDIHPSEGALSREGGYLAGNVIFIAFVVLSLLGVLYPVLVEAIKNIKTQVGPPFYNQFAIPLGWLLLFLMGIGPLLSWRRMTGTAVWKMIQLPLAFSILPTALCFLLGWSKLTVCVTVFLCAFNVCTLLTLTLQSARMKNPKAPLKGLAQLFSIYPRRYGAYLAHFGIAVLALGIAFSGAYKRQEMVKIEVNQTKTVWNKTLRYYSLQEEDLGHKEVLTARVNFGGEDLEPQINFFKNSGRSVPTPAVRYHFFGDTYAILNETDTKGQWVVVTLIDSPLVSWIWLGTLIMVLGSAVGLFSRQPSVSNIASQTTNNRGHAL